MKRAIAVLGANRFDDVDRAAQRAYLDAVDRIALARIPIRTGASKGCDQVATTRALAVGGPVQLVLPWASWEAAWVTDVQHRYGDLVHVEVFSRKEHPTWANSVTRYTTEKLTERRWREYARVWGIVTPCELVLSMTLIKERGGTGQGMRIARAQGKVVLDVRHPDDRAMLLEWMRGLP